jgi:hypothetical protein
MKLAKDLEPGDRVVMEDGTIRTVGDLARGFATFVEIDGKKRRGVLIGWAGGDRTDFSTVPADQKCTMEGDQP